MLAGCASTPLGPTYAAFPPRNKPPELFAQEDGSCRQYAANTVQSQVDATNNAQAGSAVIGTLLGAGLGAAIGGGRGAAIGAASGATLGTAYGADQTAWGQMSIQQRYDYSYSACMNSRGDPVPGYAPPPAIAYPPP